MVICRMYWRERGNPDNEGEALALSSTKEAQKAVDDGNALFPGFKHWFEKHEVPEQ